MAGIPTDALLHCKAGSALQQYKHRQPFCTCYGWLSCRLEGPQHSASAMAELDWLMHRRASGEKPGVQPLLMIRG